MKLSDKVKILIEEGYPQKQAVAIAYSMRKRGEFADGGEVQEPQPIQAEKGEQIFIGTNIVDTKATKKHSQMKDNEVTDILPPGSYVASNDKDNAITKEEAEDFVIGTGATIYSENDSLPSKIGEPITLANLFGNKKKLRPAELAKALRKKFPLTDLENDKFAEFTRKENEESRIPYIQAIMEANEGKKILNEEIEEMPEMKDGGYIKKYQKGDPVQDPTKLPNIFGNLLNVVPDLRFWTMPGGNVNNLGYQMMGGIYDRLEDLQKFPVPDQVGPADWTKPNQFTFPTVEVVDGRIGPKVTPTSPIPTPLPRRDIGTVPTLENVNIPQDQTSTADISTATQPTLYDFLNKAIGPVATKGLIHASLGPYSNPPTPTEPRTTPDNTDEYDNEGYNGDDFGLEEYLNNLPQPERQRSGLLGQLASLAGGTLSGAMGIFGQNSQAPRMQERNPYLEQMTGIPRSYYDYAFNKIGLNANRAQRMYGDNTQQFSRFASAMTPVFANITRAQSDFASQMLPQNAQMLNQKRGMQSQDWRQTTLQNLNWENEERTFRNQQIAGLGNLGVNSFNNLGQALEANRLMRAQEAAQQFANNQMIAQMRMQMEMYKYLRDQYRTTG